MQLKSPKYSKYYKLLILKIRQTFKHVCAALVSGAAFDCHPDTENDFFVKLVPYPHILHCIQNT